MYIRRCAYLTIYVQPKTEREWHSARDSTDYRDHLDRGNGKENGNYCSILGLYLDNGKENGTYHLGFGVCMV